MPVSRYAVRHLVATEVDIKLTDRENDVVEKGKRGKHQNAFGLVLVARLSSSERRSNERIYQTFQSEEG